MKMLKNKGFKHVGFMVLFIVLRSVSVLAT
jgi:hypothetical protein